MEIEEGEARGNWLEIVITLTEFLQFALHISVSKRC